MLTLRHYRIFRAVAETGSFTRAAQMLYVTQSAVSHTIRELEEASGVTLFDRLSRRVQLTAGGELLLQEVTPILASCDALEERIRHLEEQTPFRIVSSITIASFWLPQALSRLKRELPKVPVSVQVVPAAEAVKILQEGSADLALVEGAEPQGAFSCVHFGQDELKAVCAPDDPVREKVRKENRILPLRDFCGERLLLREVGSAIRDTLDSQLFLRGYTVHPSWESVNSNALIEAAKAGLGITVLPEVLLQRELDAGRLTALEVEDLVLRHDRIAVWHREKQMPEAMEKMISWMEEERRCAEK